MEILNHLMIGPLVLILALLYKFVPAKIKILSFSGVDTYSDKKIILESMRYSAKLMIFAALFTTVFQISLVLILSQWTSVSKLYAIPLSVGVLFISLIVVLIGTQHHLRKEFIFSTSFSLDSKNANAKTTTTNQPNTEKTAAGSSTATTLPAESLPLDKPLGVKKTQPAFS